MLAVLCKDIDCLLDFIERLKNEYGINLDVHRELDKLKLTLTLMWTFIQLSYFNLDGFTDSMSRLTKELQDLIDELFGTVGDDMLIKCDMDHFVPRLLKSISSISSQHPLKSSATLIVEQWVDLLDALLASFHEILYILEELMTPIHLKQCDVLQNVCRNVRDFLGLKVNGWVEPEIVESVLPQVQLMVERVGHFIFRIWTENFEDFEDFELSHLLLKIIPVALEVMHICYTHLKASKSAEVGCFIKQLLNVSTDIVHEYLIHIQNHIADVVASSTSARNINLMVEFLLIIVTGVPSDFINQDRFFDLLARVTELTREVLILVSYFEENSRNKEIVDETNCATLDLVENIELLKRDLRYVYLKVPTSSQLFFSVNDGVLFMNLLLRNLNELLNSKDYLVFLIEEEIQLVKEHLEFIFSFFKNVDQELYKDQWTRALTMACEAEHAINSILVRDHGLVQLIFLLPNIVERIKLMKEEVFNLSKKILKNRGLIVVNSPNKPVVRKSLIGKVMVGFEEERKWIIRKLIHGSTEIDVISIIGMPGLGKTTLADKVYKDDSVVSHFDILAWCTVDQECDWRKLLLKILNHVTTSNEELGEDTDVADKLRRKLYGRRFLIVLDDLWDTTTWDALTNPFPDVNKGSRIILTSRKQEVALHAKRQSDPLYLRYFKLDESLELLQNRVFGDESFPDELFDVGKEIAWHCHGLPLVVDLIAGVIATKEKEKTTWLEVLSNMNSFIFENEEEVMKIIQLSYDHLPDRVKPCLLYLGCYRKDEEIEVSELQELWSAEGFLDQSEMSEMKTVEEVTEDYLDDLISSSLVVVEKSDFRKATCKIHDLVHDFCQVKATNEKFFHLISSNPLPCAPDLMSRRLTIANCDSIKVVSGKYLLSLKVEESLEFPFDSDLLVQLRHLRLLRVFKLPDAKTYLRNSLVNEIGLLVHLRYLHIQMFAYYFPSSLSNLRNLETLVVENSGTVMVLLPNIWNLVKLRHVRIDSCTFFDVYSDEPILLVEDSKLENLRTLEGLVIFPSKDRDDIYTRFPNLQRLQCTIRDPSPDESSWFPRLDLLNKLEELDVCHRYLQESLGADICFPVSLKELVFTNFYLTPDSQSKIVKLPNLAKLTLQSTRFQDEEWNMGEEDTFRKLTFLGLVGVKLSKWQLGEESFPVLERLHLKTLPKLQEIPSSFADIDPLSLIELDDCSHLKDSALKIKKDVEDISGNDKLQVVIRYWIDELEINSGSDESEINSDLEA